jgi:exopolysaccharide biosynthesis polyprenyl glycosylphosphotransferase
MGNDERDGRAKHVYPVPLRLSSWQLAVKRAIDLIASVVMLPIIVPLGTVIGIAIKLDSQGPVLYRQKRIGKDGGSFTMYKFRSMRRDAEELRRTLDDMNEAEGPIFKMRKDPRVTRVGAILRKTSLDELPQIMNVIQGNMSLVGPRPPLPDEVAQYSEHQFGRLAVTPGITCLWQVQGRSSLPFDKWVELDLEYIRRQSLWLDFVILLRTIVVVAKSTGAW